MRTRGIAIDGRRYLWRYPLEKHSAGYATHGTTWAPDTLIVRPTEGARCCLTVTWPACTGSVVTPGLVRVCIEAGQRRGWLTQADVLVLAGAEFSGESSGD